MSSSTPWPRLTAETTPGSRETKGGRAGFQWSYRLGTLAGIPIRVHATFALLLIWIALSHVMEGHGPAEIGLGILLVLSIFACVILHELSHALVAKRFGIRTRDIVLLPIGGVAQLERMPEKPSQELWVALVGPVASLAIAGALFGLVTLLGIPTGLHALHIVGGPFLTKLMWINVTLAVFNLLPAFPMDGGRALRAVLAMGLDRARATEVAAQVARGMALLFGILGLLYNPFLIIIAVFVWIGATAEVTFEQLKSALSGVTVSQAMITQFRVLAPRDTLSDAARLTLSGFQHEFPVVDGARLVGVLTHADALKGLAARGPETPVETVMQRNFETAAPSDLLTVAFEKLQGCNCRALVVVHEGEVVGLLTPGNIGEMLMMNEALRAARAPRPWRR